jgi:hypothetical protein
VQHPNAIRAIGSWDNPLQNIYLFAILVLFPESTASMNELHNNRNVAMNKKL